LTNVSVATYENIYNYDQAILWIAYGLSIFFSLLGVIAGVIALLLNGASYSDNFSTALRLGQTMDLGVKIQSQDGSGQDPLPGYLRKARLNIAGYRDHSKTQEAQERPAPRNAEMQRLVSGPRSAPPRGPAIEAHRVTW
jgi:hypothetical protein